MDYEIVRRLGRGGMGVVDLARSPDGELVALKRLSLHGTPEELARARQRIRREAEVLQRLDHPGVVRLREVLDEDDDVVLVMDHLPGGNLAQRVNEDGPLPAEAVAALADQLLDALAAAHRQGIVHRDIKPANVLFDADGHPHLADFGVAVHRDATPGLTATEVVVGTPAFMAPEQARGEDATAASDVFSLGATLRFAATGTGPYGTADQRVLLLRASAGRIERTPSTVPEPLRSRIDALLAKDPSARPSAAQARGGTTDGTVIAPAPKVRRPLLSSRARRVVGGVALGILIVGGGLAIALSGGNGRQPGTATTTRPRPATTTAPCTPLPYRPCGEDDAPHTDGRRCTDDHADYDGDATNGCEAQPDSLADDAPLEGVILANLVPTEDEDTYLLDVSDKFQFDCGGEIHVTLTAPAGATQKVTILDGQDGSLGEAVSGGGVAATVTVGDPNCGSDDGGTLRVRVTSVGSDRAATRYRLEARGSF